MTRSKRVEHLNPVFSNGMADQWVFGVADAFRVNLDIRYDARVDSVASKAKELRLGRKLQPNEKVKRYVWTQGAPPAYSFARGHIFHDPPIAHRVSWDAVLPILRRSIVVLDARADPGALVEVHSDEESDSASLVVEEDHVKSDSRGPGWVDIEVLYYDGGQLVTKEKTTRTQSALVDMLRTGTDALNASFNLCRCNSSSATYTCLKCSPRVSSDPVPLFRLEDMAQ
jgi:hypothetical protein